MCSNLTIKRPERRHGVFIVNFIVNFTCSGVFIVNFEHISRLAQCEECRNTCFILEKEERKVSLTDCKLKCFSSRI